MLVFPQALALVAQQLILLLYPAVLTFALCSILDSLVHAAVPTWAYALIATTSIPASLAGRIWFRDWIMARKAARVDAILVPRWNGKAIGNTDILKLLLVAFETGYISDYLSDKLQEVGGTFCMYTLWDPTYVTSDANIIKPLIIESIFLIPSLTGDMWKFHRSMTRPFFSRDRISHFELFDRHAGQAIRKLKDRLGEGHAVDFQDLISRFTLDSATEFLFGSCVHSLRNSLPYPHNVPMPGAHQSPAEDFAKAFAEAQTAIAHRSRVGWIWPWSELFHDKTESPMHVVDAYLDPILKAALKKAEDEQRFGVANGKVRDDLEEDETLLDHLVRYTTDPIVLHDEVLNIMIAGRDTYPTVLRRLRDEIFEKVGQTRRPTYEDIRNMKYLRAVLNAEEFDPDRFIDSRLHKYLTPNPFIFLPFNAGPRICLGQQFAYNEMSFFLIRLLQTFETVSLDVEAQPADSRPPAEWANWPGRKGVEKFWPKVHLTLYSKGGLWVRMDEAKNSDTE
ncbi:hypothetical protein PHLCEN_2v9389 [Hermanssonia centrifuga]|uniref:Cytochrome P450 n=1 Tax=Hermanssonia centrifuga TaxID=98765 RepID=A0A2R6NRL8_9APHY|nr:hypothetical protein PHLCEN_2v9389 [Hermanssonia centrifuga]